MNLISSKITISDYLVIDIEDKAYDDIEDAKVVFDVVFDVDVMSTGANFRVYEVKNVAWSYTGVVFADENDSKTEVETSADDSWTVTVKESKNCNNENIGLHCESIEIQPVTKTITIDFTC